VKHRGSFLCGQGKPPIFARSSRDRGAGHHIAANGQ